MGTIFAFSPDTGEAMYYTDSNPGQQLAQAGFEQTGIFVDQQPDATTPEIWTRFAGGVPGDVPVPPQELSCRDILERSIARVTDGTPWVRSVWTKTQALQWAAAHPAAAVFAVFKQ